VIREPERWFPSAATILVAASRLTSLFAGEAPFEKHQLEQITFFATLPSSLISLPVEAQGGYESIGLWLVATVVWLACTYLQFLALAKLPATLSKHQKLLRLSVGVGIGGVLVCLLWGLALVPARVEEEPTSYFIRAPLIVGCAFAVLLILSWMAKAQRTGV